MPGTPLKLDLPTITHACTTWPPLLELHVSIAITPGQSGIFPDLLTVPKNPINVNSAVRPRKATL